VLIDQAPPTVRVEKPWGYFEQFTHNALSTVKIITVDPGGTLSLQYHHRRDELWVIMDSGAQVELGDRVIRPGTGEKVFIPRRMPHRLSAIGNTAVRILEVSFGEFDEDDIVRVEDIYGRAGSPTP
jgi:mannose-6-phosphate isomerase